MNVRSYQGDGCTWIDIEWAQSAYDWKYEDFIRGAQQGSWRIIHDESGGVYLALQDVIGALGMPSYNKHN